MSRFVARIAYTNTEPFFFHWPLHEFPLISGVPRELAEQAALERDDILAGPLPLVETWKLADRFAPLAWGIAARESCQSVLLLSNRPLADLNKVTIGVTMESSTSLALCEIILRERYGLDIELRRGLQLNDEAWLVIGDQALRIFSGPRLGRWKYMTDLASEWWDWQKLPFVFARWVINKNSPFDERNRLIRIIGDTLASGLASISSIALYQSSLLKVPAQAITDYLAGLTFELGPDEEAGARRFADLAQKYIRPTATV